MHESQGREVKAREEVRPKIADWAELEVSGPSWWGRLRLPGRVAGQIAGDRFKDHERLALAGRDGTAPIPSNRQKGSFLSS